MTTQNTIAKGIIHVHAQGGFGNHLLAYGAALVLASKHDMQVHFIPNNIVGDTDHIRNDTRSALSSIIKPFHSEDGLTSPFEIINVRDMHQFYDLLLNKTSKQLANTRVHLRMISMHINHYHYHADMIKQHLDLNNIDIPPLPFLPYKHDIVVSFRLGMGSSEVVPDAFVNTHRIPFTYYVDALSRALAINKTKLSRVIVCSDNFEDAYISQFHHMCSTKGLDVIYANWNTLQQFKCIFAAKTIISSNSSFSVISSILSEATHIYFPCFKSSNTMYRDPPSDETYKLFHIDIGPMSRYEHLYIDG